jgi:hypothetical protein
MDVLRQIPLNPYLARSRPMLEAGGLWSAWYMADPRDIVNEARTLGVRALEYSGPHAGLVSELPQLEYLILQYIDDPEPLYSIEHLRGLHFAGGWEGMIDFQRLPCLEMFAVSELPRDEGGLETLYAGHDCMRDLSIQRYRHEDLTPLAKLNLEKVGILYTRKLTSLNGLGLLAPTLRRLTLHACSNLTTVDGLANAPDLETLELGSLRHIRTLEFAQDLPNLRRLDLFELANVESLWPIAGHPSLEFVMFGRIRDRDPVPLSRLPRLKFFLGGNFRGDIDMHSLPEKNDFDEDHPYVQEWHSLEP